MSSMLRVVAAGVLLLAVVRPFPAAADGGFFWPTTTWDYWYTVEAEVGYSADQRGIIVFEAEDEVETLVLHTEYDGGRADYAWIIPVPHLPKSEDIDTMADGWAAFDQLYHKTEPRGVITGPAFLCACGAGAGDGTSYPGVNVVDTLSIDNYRIALLEADDSRNLGRWLNDNEYRFPEEAEDELAYYVAKDWRFVAVRIALPSGGGTGEGQRQDPLKMMFATDEIVFPLRISNVSSRQHKQTEILLYVFSTAGRVKVRKGFATPEMDLGLGTFETEEGFREAYQQMFQVVLNRYGGRAFVVEYAQWMEPWWLSNSAMRELFHPNRRYYLTRLRTFLDRDDMAEDVYFTRAPTDQPFQIVRSIEPRAKRERRLYASALVLLCATLVGVHGHSRRSFLRAYLAALLVLLAVL